jgi:transposase
MDIAVLGVDLGKNVCSVVGFDAFGTVVTRRSRLEPEGRSARRRRPRSGLKLDRRIAALDAEFVGWAKENEEARRLTTIPGIGAIARRLSPPSVRRKASSAPAILRPGSAWCSS